MSVSGLRTGNATIDELVGAGKARWIARVECARTYYRHAKWVTGDSITLNIDGRELDGAVDLGLAICAIKSIQGFSPVGMHRDYGSQTFNLDEGDVLGLGGEFRFTVDKDFDPLRASVGSFMRVSEGESETGSFYVDLTGELIEVLLPKSDFAAWNAIKGHAPELLHASIVVPALMQALEKIDEFKGSKWADRLGVLLHRLSESPVQPPLADSLDRAQALLLGPRGRGAVGRSLDRVLSILEEDL